MSLSSIGAPPASTQLLAAVVETGKQIAASNQNAPKDPSPAEQAQAAPRAKPAGLGGAVDIQA